MDTESRAKELALTGAMLAFFAIALVALAAGAEGYAAALRGLVAGALVAFAGPFPARVLLEALEPPAREADEPPSAAEAPAAQAPAAQTRARARGADAA